MNSNFASERVRVINAIKDNIRTGQTLDQIRSCVSLQNYDMIIKWLKNNSCLRFVESENRFLYNYERLSSVEEFESELGKRPIRLTNELVEASYESFMTDLAERKSSFQVLEVVVEPEAMSRQKKSDAVQKAATYKILYMNPFYSYGFDMDYPVLPDDVLSWYHSINYDDIVPTFSDVEILLNCHDMGLFQLDCDAPRLKSRVKRRRKKMCSLGEEVFESEVAQLARKEFKMSKDDEPEKDDDDINEDRAQENLYYNRIDHPQEWFQVNRAIWMVCKTFYNNTILVILGLFLEKKCYDEYELEEKMKLTRKRIMDSLSVLWKHGLIVRGVSEVKSSEFTKKLSSKWEFSLNRFFNVIAYRLLSFPKLLETKISALKDVYLECTLCRLKFSLHDLVNLRTVAEDAEGEEQPSTMTSSRYLCSCSMSTRLRFADESEAIRRHQSILERSRGVFDPFLAIFFALNKKVHATSTVRSETGNALMRSRGDAMTMSGGRQQHSNARKGYLAARSAIRNANGEFNEMANLDGVEDDDTTAVGVNVGNGVGMSYNHADLNFNDRPIMFNSANEILLPIVDENAAWSRELGIQTAKLLLDCVAMFDRMSDGHYVYRITRHSLYIAFQHGFLGTEIVRILTLLSADPMSAALFLFIMDEAAADEYYRVSITLNANQYILQSHDESCIRKIVDMNNYVPAFETPGEYEKVTIDKRVLYRVKLRKNDVSFISDLKRMCRSHNCPIVESYEFYAISQQTSSLHLPIQLKLDVCIRDYQLLACSKLFWDGFKIHSGVLVLPCGAGKTLIGIAILSMIKKHTIIFCQSTLAVTQWRDSLVKWTTIDEKGKDISTGSRIVSRLCKSYQNEWYANAAIIITTYPMFSSRTNRTDMSRNAINTITNREWGLMILDEVHQAPADVFQQVTSCFKVHTKLGLTATLVREDEKVKELPNLVGPKLFELDIFTLLRQGHLAPVKCFEIQCKFTKYFQERYDAVTENASRERRLLYVTNLNKTRICYSLISKHLQMGHKVMVFCDDLFGLHWYHKMLNFDMIEGDTPEQQREIILKKFRSNTTGSCILCSRVGDMSLDLPEAQVVIQLTILAGSRMQEGQRIGRVQRPHPSKNTAYFYSLVTNNTHEEEFASKRRKYLVNHGYVVTVQCGDEVNQYYDDKTLTFYKDEQVVYNAIIKDLNNDNELKKNKKNKNKRNSKSTVLETQIKRIKLNNI